MKTCTECGDRFPEEEGTVNEKGKFICLACSQEAEGEEDRSICPECGESSAEFETSRACPHCDYQEESDGSDGSGEDEKDEE